LRLEIAFKIDKKKNEKKEFYFSSRRKFDLTGKQKQTCPRENKKFLSLHFRAAKRSTDSQCHGETWRFDRIGACTQFFRLHNAIGTPTKNAGDPHKDENLAGEVRPFSQRCCDRPNSFD
jgi:hypothetical protein